MQRQLLVYFFQFSRYLPIDRGFGEVQESGIPCPFIPRKDYRGQIFDVYKKV